jgi:DNA ligase-associated metallophosphoesterase
VNAVTPGFAYEIAQAACGSLRTCVAKTEAMLRPSGALWLAAEAALVVADLHLEKGSAYARRGQMLPPYDTRETLARLQAEVARLAPRILVFLGDSFHDGAAEARMDAADAARVAALARGRHLVWVVGNHDADGPRGLPGETAAELGVAGLALRHEPHGGATSGEVCGHLHPAAKVRTPRGAVRRRCFATDGERLVMPAFGVTTGGLDLRHRAMEGLFDRSRLLAHMLGRERIYTVRFANLVG